MSSLNVLLKDALFKSNVSFNHLFGIDGLVTASKGVTSYDVQWRSGANGVLDDCSEINFTFSFGF